MMDDTTLSEQWIIEFYADSRGNLPALAFIEGLPKHEQAPMYRTIDLLRKYGPALNTPHAEHIEGKLWELRAGAGRVFYFLHIERRFILLHGYRKKSQKAPKREISRAMRYMDDFQRGERNGS